jgi:hypothetical protein
VRDFLDLVFTQIFESDRQTIVDLVTHRAADIDSARLRQALHPLGDVDTLAVYEVAIGDLVAKAIAIRNWIHRRADVSSMCCGISLCSLTAQRTASTTLLNSTNRPSPIVRTIRPLCAAIVGSTRLRRTAFSAARVPSSSIAMRRE